ncbi:MAG: NAD(P)/FAD-dependent oxidoreductase [Chloroflexi bacterium]|nr:NAD(P)/FAD-dependent oxidoreductase [Chloroflexota bacterium]
MAGKTVLILGGGVGGLVAANELRRRLGQEHRIVVVDKNGQHLFSPSLPWVMVGWRHPEEITKDLRRMVHPGVEVVQAQVQAIDPAKQKVRTEAGELDYDYLVVALGAELAPEAMPGYAEAAHNFFTLDGAAALASALKVFSGGRVAVVVSKLPYKCPAVPYEAALLLHDVFRRRGLLRQIDLQVFTPESLPMPVAGPVLGGAVKGMLEEIGIGFHSNVQLESIDPGRRELKFQGGATASFDLLVAAPPHRPPQALKGSGLTNEAGWVSVDRKTLRTSYDSVYAVGDVTSITLPNGKPLPKAGVFAHAEAQVVAHHIAADIQGAKSTEGFDGFGYCWIEMGNGRAGFASGNFYAEPNPAVQLQRPGRLWHWGKGFFETYWLGDGLGRMSSRWALLLGSRLFRVPASL